ncbi:tetratricopeptide repeat protein [Sphingomicrobium flavum]|uniref:tetratricopeptide repeat protein n=1 Tax=Sphingomicrobium flavum TaxID=1229164 RepID=UPI0021AD8F6B|nr:hypothetical protein [Sphingomicrobium flavum]
MSLTLALLSLSLAAQDLPLPGEVLRCGTDRSAATALCQAVVAQEEGRHENSATFFEQAASLSGADSGQASRALVAAGNMWMLAGDAAKAASVIDKALALAVLDPTQRGLALMDRARVSAMALEPAAATSFARQAQVLIPDDPFPWYFTAGLALYAGKHEEAKVDIDRALALAADSADVLLRAAAIAEALGDDMAMRTYLEQAAATPESESSARAARLLALLNQPRQESPE